MSESQMIFHVGLHKTATSFLQRRIYPLLEGIAYAGYPPPDGQTLRRVAGLMRPGLPMLVSDEQLSGHPFRRSWIEEFETNVRGLAALFPDARIIVGFRHHRPWVISIYKQYLNKGGTRTLAAFLGLDGADGLIRERDTRFGTRLDLLEALFPGRVFVHTQ